MDLIYLFLLALAILINSVLFFLLFRYSQKNSAIVSLIILLALINIWFAPKFIINAFHPSALVFETLSRIAALGYIFVPPIFLVFTLSYGMYNKIFHTLSFWTFLIVPAFFFLYLSWTTNLIGVHDPNTAVLYDWGYETPTGELWSYYISWYEGIMALALSVLFYHYLHLQDNSKKRQLFSIILAVVIPFFVTTITTGLLPMFNIFIFPIGLILLNLMTIVGVTIIYRYGWFVITPFSVLANINHAIISVDQEGMIMQMNPSSEKILRAKASQTNGRMLEKMVYLQDIKKKKRYQFNQILKPVFDKGRSLTYDNFEIVNRRSQVFYHTISISPIYQEKDIVGANIFLQDTSREKEREKQRDDILKMMSHEIKTPITSIKAYNQLLLKEFSHSSDRKKQLAINMDNQLNRLTRLIQDFMELTQLQSGKLKMKRELFELDPFVVGLVETMKVTYKTRKFKLKGSSHCAIFADKDRIEQLFINFITNAIKYSEEDKPINILISRNESHVTIGVQDFGLGISTKYQKKIFNPFFRIEGRDRGNAGLGIGLFIASMVARANDGKVWFESEEGVGSVFYCSLPIIEERG